MPRGRCKYSIAIRSYPRGEIFLIGGQNSCGNVLRSIDCFSVSAACQFTGGPLNLNAPREPEFELN